MHHHQEVDKEIPYGTNKTKTVLYFIRDHLFRFWFRFVDRSLNEIENHQGALVYDSLLRSLPDYMEKIFEEICAEFIWYLSGRKQLPLLPRGLGRYWGNDPRTHSQVEIDLMGEDGLQALFCECKWRNAPMGREILDDLIYKAALFKHSEKHYYLFSKSGFTSKLRKAAEDLPHVHLFSFEDMVKAWSIVSEDSAQ